MEKQNLDWFTVDTDTLPVNVKAAYAKLQKANAAAKEAKEAFESAFKAEAKKAERIDSDVELRFGYNFGRLAIAKAPKGAEQKKAKPKFSF
jgi:hypothetical protein